MRRRQRKWESAALLVVFGAAVTFAVAAVVAEKRTPASIKQKHVAYDLLRADEVRVSGPDIGEYVLTSAAHRKEIGRCIREGPAALVLGGFQFASCEGVGISLWEHDARLASIRIHLCGELIPAEKGGKGVMDIYAGDETWQLTYSGTSCAADLYDKLASEWLDDARRE